MPNIGIKELSSVLERSGLPFGDSSTMQQAGLGAGNAIQSSVYGADTQVPQLQNNYKSQLDQLAAMDQKLAGVYGDRNSSLYLENPLQRERLISGASNTGYRAASVTKQKIKQRESELDDEVDEALKLYKELTKMQIDEEKKGKQEYEDNEAISRGTKKKVMINGKETVVRAYKGKGSGSGTSGMKLTKDQKLAGFTDAEAANYWTKIKDADFKRLWVQDVIEKGVPEEGFDIRYIDETYKAFKESKDDLMITLKEKKPPKDKKSKALFGTDTDKKVNIFK